MTRTEELSPRRSCKRTRGLKGFPSRRGEKSEELSAKGRTFRGRQLKRTAHSKGSVRECPRGGAVRGAASRRGSIKRELPRPKGTPVGRVFPAKGAFRGSSPAQRGSHFGGLPTQRGGSQRSVSLRGHQRLPPEEDCQPEESTRTPSGKGGQIRGAPHFERGFPPKKRAFSRGLPTEGSSPAKWDIRGAGQQKKSCPQKGTARGAPGQKGPLKGAFSRRGHLGAVKPKKGLKDSHRRGGSQGVSGRRGRPEELLGRRRTSQRELPTQKGSSQKGAGPQKRLSPNRGPSRSGPSRREQSEELPSQRGKLRGAATKRGKQPKGKLPAEDPFRGAAGPRGGSQGAAQPKRTFQKEFASQEEQSKGAAKPKRTAGSPSRRGAPGGFVTPKGGIKDTKPKRSSQGAGRQRSFSEGPQLKSAQRSCHRKRASEEFVTKGGIKRSLSAEKDPQGSLKNCLRAVREFFTPREAFGGAASRRSCHPKGQSGGCPPRRGEIRGASAKGAKRRGQRGPKTPTTEDLWEDCQKRTVKGILPAEKGLFEGCHPKGERQGPARQRAVRGSGPPKRGPFRGLSQEGNQRSFPAEEGEFGELPTQKRAIRGLPPEKGAFHELPVEGGPSEELSSKRAFEELYPRRTVWGLPQNVTTRGLGEIKGAATEKGQSRTKRNFPRGRIVWGPLPEKEARAVSRRGAIGGTASQEERRSVFQPKRGHFWGTCRAKGKLSKGVSLKEHFQELSFKGKQFEELSSKGENCRRTGSTFDWLSPEEDLFRRKSAEGENRVWGTVAEEEPLGSCHIRKGPGGLHQRETVEGDVNQRGTCWSVYPRGRGHARRFTEGESSEKAATVENLSEGAAAKKDPWKTGQPKRFLQGAVTPKRGSLGGGCQLKGSRGELSAEGDPKRTQLKRPSKELSAKRGSSGVCQLKRSVGGLGSSEELSAKRGSVGGCRKRGVPWEGVTEEDPSGELSPKGICGRSFQFEEDLGKNPVPKRETVRKPPPPKGTVGGLSQEDPQGAVSRRDLSEGAVAERIRLGVLSA
ncbi:collagen alpha-1(I) chain-like [Penaeus monodon]|uniref:collagen alpha-1(I) chain-like n=1 Tax=Penaeus monodon TaxID=6687 RepID=UPI0018A7066D|nr:collagen alpha-1(I) chain-like [Penaeus monodon]